MNLQDRLLRAWLSFREWLGIPVRLTDDEFDQASPTLLAAGSPWVHSSTTVASSETYVYWTSNTRWSAQP